MFFHLRPIEPDDNRAIAHIIRQVLTEYGANCTGFAWDDPELDALSTAYQGDRAAYFVATVENVVVGGAGLAPFPCEYPNLCELQKMYLLPAYRGQGLGKALMTSVLATAQQMAYDGCYLETFDGMERAIAFYEAFGFRALPKPLGNSGHTACNRFYLRWLTP